MEKLRIPLRLLNKIEYEITRLNIFLLKLCVTIAKRCAFLLRKRRPKKDLLMLPYVPAGGVGARVRFEIYAPFLERDGVLFEIFYPGQQTDVYDAFLAPDHQERAFLRFRYLRRLIWLKFVWCLQASNYRAIYIQRGLHPGYLGAKRDILMELMAAVNPNITLDFYDADYEIEPALVSSSVRCAAKVTVVNDYLKTYFSQFHSNISLFPLALSKAPYLVKKDYTLSRPARLFWTGSYPHLKNFESALEALREVRKKFDFVLVLITNKVVEYENLSVEHHYYDLSTFYQVMESCDIGLYPVARGDVRHKGAMAMKAIEYIAAGLPVVGSPWGLSPFLEDGNSILIAHSKEEWVEHLEMLLGDEELREKMGRNGHKIFLDHHESEISYQILKNVLEA